MRRSEILALTAVSVLATRLPARAQSAAPVRIGIVPVEEGAVVAYAQLRGTFAQAGVQVEITKFPNGAAVAQGVVAGALDAGVTNSGSMSLAHERGLPLVLVAGCGMYTRESPLCHFITTKTSGIHGAKDFAGKSVATSAIRDMLNTSALAWIDQNGGDAKAVKFIEIPFPAMAAAVTTARVDGATIVEPFFSAARADVAEIGLPYTAVNGGRPFQTLGLVANRSWAEQNAAVAAKLAAAVHATARWANANKSDAAKLLAGFTGVEPAVIAAYPRVVFAETNDADNVQPVIDMMARYGSLQKPFPASALFAPGMT